MALRSVSIGNPDEPRLRLRSLQSRSFSIRITDPIGGLGFRIRKHVSDFLTAEARIRWRMECT